MPALQPCPEPTALYFVLASTSPRRREFLEALKIPFTVISPGSVTDNGDIDETPLPNEPPANLVQRLSRIKAQTVVDNLPYKKVSNPTSTIAVIAADTVVVLDSRILGKPASPKGATEMLKMLRQRPHYVYSGITVVRVPQKNSGKICAVTRLHKSTVWMRPYTDAEIEVYVAGGSPLDKAGAYGIQDQGFSPVARLEGCFASVMGLPLGELANALAELNIALPSIGPICARHTSTSCCQNAI